MAGRAWTVRLAGLALLAALVGVASDPAPQNQCPPVATNPSPTGGCTQPWIWPDDRPVP